jgi:hypothetical protein
MIISLLGLIASLASYFFLGLYLEAKPKTVKRTNQQSADNKSSIEKLSSLKALLDKGIITQEEFEEKKKELLASK